MRELPVDFSEKFRMRILLRIVFGQSFVLALWLVCMPVAARADGNHGFFREAGAWLGVARTTYGGQFIEDSPATRVPAFGVAAGAFARLEIARWNGVGLGMQPELSYSPRGADVELEGVFIGRSRATYLEFPILGRIESPALGPLAFHAVTGFAPGILLTARSEDMNGNSLNARDGTSKFDVGLAVGVGATLMVTRQMALSLETRYTHGFRTTDDAGEVEIQNRAFFFTLGVSARFGVQASSSLTQ